MGVTKYCHVAKWPKLLPPKLLPPKYSFHYVLCQQPCSFSEVPCSQAVCLRDAWCCCPKPCSISWPMLSTRSYQRWVRISYLEFLLLASWGILCIPDSDMAYPKDKGKWKTLQAKSSFVQTWSMLRLGSICHLKQLFFCFVFPYGKKTIILQTRYFSFKGWVFLWLFFTLQWNLSTELLGQELVLQAVRLQKWQ